MKKKMAVGVMVVALLTAMVTGVEKFKDSKFETTTVINVVDGDTFDTENGERVRLYGVNAPEYPNGCMAEDSKKRLGELILNKKIKIINKGKDNFGRTLGIIYIDKLLINKVLVIEGLAVYEGKQNPNDRELLEIENTNNEAKMAQRGLWSSKCSQPDPKCVIKGNYRRVEKTYIYTLPECYNYEKIVIDPTGKDKWFCGEAEAIKAGFVKSKDCPGMK